MQIDDVLGHDNVKKQLVSGINSGRVAHAQLFVGEEGTGLLPMAIAYARLLICGIQGDNANCELQMNSLAHPDLHFAFPVATTTHVKKNPVSDNFVKEFREFYERTPYANLYQWYEHIGLGNKQGNISVHEAMDVVKKLSLKSYQGGYKVMIIWGADNLNIAASNKLLKMIEEPPEKTVFILLTNSEESIIQTILSRCQITHFQKLSEAHINEGLIAHGVEPSYAKVVARQAQGSYNRALQLIHHSADTDQYEQWFIRWVRTAFSARGNKGSVLELIKWSEDLAKSGRETQKRFLDYALEFFRQGLMENYNVTELIYLNPKTSNFNLSKFAPFVKGAAIEQIMQELETANYHIERNANPKITFTDLSMKLTRLIHMKE